MGEFNDSDQFTILENKTIGRNLARFRKFKDKKALEVAEYLGMTEAGYSKYERGENKITIEIIQKVSESIDVDPLLLITMNDGRAIENVTLSPFANNGTVSTTNEKQNEMMLKLMENVIDMNEKLIKLLDKERK